MSFKRVIIKEFGSPDVLQLVEDATLPVPQPGEVRVQEVDVNSYIGAEGT